MVGRQTLEKPFQPFSYESTYIAFAFPAVQHFNETIYIRPNMGDPDDDGCGL